MKGKEDVPPHHDAMGLWVDSSSHHLICGSTARRRQVVVGNTYRDADLGVVHVERENEEWEPGLSQGQHGHAGRALLPDTRRTR